MSRRNRNRRGWRAGDGDLDAEIPGFETTQDRRGRERRARREQRNLREREADEQRRRPANTRGTRPGAAPVAVRRSPAYAFDADGPIQLLPQAVRGCGTCRNWRPDDLPGGRGTCDHPGSGFLNPYADTPACPFYDG